MVSLRRLLSLGLLLLLSACTAREADQREDRIVVGVSILPQAEFAERVGGKRIEVVVMIPPGANPHHYEPTPSQLAAISTARLYAQVGSGLPFEETWMDKLRSLNSRMLVINCAAGIEVIDQDPHIWLSPRLARIMVANLCQGLIHLDPEHQREYEQNRDQYLEALEELDRDLARTLAGLSRRQFMVYHPSWGYFARDYGLEEIAVEEEGKEPTIQYMASLIAQARSQGIDAIFISPQFAERSAQTLAAELGARLISVDPLPRNYLDTLRQFGELLASQR